MAARDSNHKLIPIPSLLVDDLTAAPGAPDRSPAEPTAALPDRQRGERR